jgi:hypothetical protein
VHNSVVYSMMLPSLMMLLADSHDGAGEGVLVGFGDLSGFLYLPISPMVWMSSLNRPLLSLRCSLANRRRVLPRSPETDNCRSP